MNTTTRYYTEIIRLIATGAFAVAVLSGCATSVPKPTFTKELPVESRVASNDQVKATVTAKDGVDILPIERERLAQRIDERVSSKKSLNPARTNPRTFNIEVHLTRYEKGSAFARAMLAGLGQIHVDGTATLIEAPENKTLATFDLKKTFAWGGMYGASTTIEEIERAFAEGVAAAVTGQIEPAPGKTGSSPKSK